MMFIFISIFLSPIPALYISPSQNYLAVGWVRRIFEISYKIKSNCFIRTIMWYVQYAGSIPREKPRITLELYNTRLQEKAAHGHENLTFFLPGTFFFGYRTHKRKFSDEFWTQHKLSSRLGLTDRSTFLNPYFSSFLLVCSESRHRKIYDELLFTSST